eukprot:m.15236 g.15236  ORF g.15236 m.15236 type:complete len:1447 (-) comp7345_c0_seq1:61-4401(-)
MEDALRRRSGRSRDKGNDNDRQMMGFFALRERQDETKQRRMSSVEADGRQQQQTTRAASYFLCLFVPRAAHRPSLHHILVAAVVIVIVIRLALGAPGGELGSRGSSSSSRGEAGEGSLVGVVPGRVAHLVLLGLVLLLVVVLLGSRALILAALLTLKHVLQKVLRHDLNLLAAVLAGLLRAGDGDGLVLVVAAREVEADAVLVLQLAHAAAALADDARAHARVGDDLQGDVAGELLDALEDVVAGQDCVLLVAGQDDDVGRGRLAARHVDVDVKLRADLVDGGALGANQARVVLGVHLHLQLEVLQQDVLQVDHARLDQLLGLLNVARLAADEHSLVRAALRELDAHVGLVRQLADVLALGANEQPVVLHGDVHRHLHRHQRLQRLHRLGAGLGLARDHNRLLRALRLLLLAVRHRRRRVARLGAGQLLRTRTRSLGSLGRRLSIAGANLHSRRGGLLAGLLTTSSSLGLARLLVVVAAGGGRPLGHLDAHLELVGDLENVLAGLAHDGREVLVRDVALDGDAGVDVADKLLDALDGVVDVGAQALEDNLVGALLARQVDLDAAKLVAELLEELAAVGHHLLQVLLLHLDRVLDRVLQLRDALLDLLLGQRNVLLAADDGHNVALAQRRLGSGSSTLLVGSLVGSLVSSSRSSSARAAARDAGGREDEAAAGVGLELLEEGAGAADEEAVELALDGDLVRLVVGLGLLGELEDAGLGLGHGGLGAADDDLVRLVGLVGALREVDHDAKLLHDRVDDLALGADDGGVEARVDGDLLDLDVLELVLDGEELVAGGLDVLSAADDDDEVAAFVVLGHVDLRVGLLLDLLDVGALLADDAAVELAEDGHLNLVLLLLQRAQELLDVRLGGVDVLAVAAHGDNLRVGVRVRHLDGDAVELGDNVGDGGALGPDQRRVELLVDDHVDALGVLQLRHDSLDGCLGRLHRLGHALDAHNVRVRVALRDGDLRARLGLDLVNRRALAAHQVPVVLRINLDLGVGEAALQFAAEGLEEGLDELDLVGRALDVDGLGLLDKLDVDARVVGGDLLDVGAGLADDVLVEPGLDLEGHADVAVGLLVDHGQGVDEVGLGAAQDEHLAVRLRGRHLHHNAGLLHNLLQVLALGANHILVLRLLDLRRELAAGDFLLLVDGVQLGDGAGDAVLLAADDNLVLINRRGRDVDLDARLLDDALDGGLVEAGDERVVGLKDGQAHDVELGLFVGEQLDDLGGLADVLGGADDLDNLRVLRGLGDADVDRVLVAELLELVAALANESRVVGDGDAQLNHGLGLEAVEEELLGDGDVLALAGDEDGEGAVLAHGEVDHGVGLLLDLAHLLRRVVHALADRLVARLLNGDGEDLGRLGRAEGGPGDLRVAVAAGSSAAARQSREGVVVVGSSLFGVAVGWFHNVIHGQERKRVRANHTASRDAATREASTGGELGTGGEEKPWCVLSS